MKKIFIAFVHFSFYPILIFTMSIYPYNYAAVKNIIKTDIKKMTEYRCFACFPPKERTKTK